MKKLNFKILPVRDIEGKLEPFDFSKTFGNHIFNETFDLAEHELGRKIYFEGEIVVNEEELCIIQKYIKNFKVIIRKAFEEMLSEAEEV